jgi:hypothetical protein
MAASAAFFSAVALADGNAAVSLDDASSLVGACGADGFLAAAIAVSKDPHPPPTAAAGLGARVAADFSPSIPSSST